MNLKINPELELDQLADQFQAEKKIRIDNFLTVESAEMINQCLRDYTAWHLVYSDDVGQPVRLDNNQLAALSADEYQNITQQLHLRATSNYQYIYKFYPIIDAIKTGTVTENSQLYEIATFLNSAKFINFARRLTKSNSIVKMDPQATLYESGHFLNLHDDMGGQRDTEGGSVRRFAVVLGFTKNWSSNWGGETNFFSSAGSAKAEAWYPVFNSMTVFQVPSLHSVGMIMPFSGKGRYSVTGWLREDSSVLREDLEEV